MTLQTFICSAFNHTPSPARGPIACKEFWDSISSACSLNMDDCPERLATYLLALQDAYDGPAPLPSSDAATEIIEENQDSMVRAVYNTP